MKSDNEHTDEVWKVQKKCSRKEINAMENTNFKYHNQCNVSSEDNEYEKDDEEEEFRYEITYKIKW